MAHQTDPLKLGLIGCGGVAERAHLPALRHLPDAEIIALSDVNAGRLTRLAERFHIKNCYADFRELLSDPAIEAVAVCVPPQFHSQVALAVVDAGKHLFIEKPLALDLIESDRLIERAARSPVKIMVGFNLRWHRLVQQARAIIRQETFGPIELVRTVLTSNTRYHRNPPEWRKRRETGGGEFFETAVHHFDLWRFLLQTEIDEVFATSRSEHWDDETAVVIARLANGVVAVSAFSTGTAGSNDVEIFGRGGRLSLSLMRFDGLEFIPGTSLPGKMRTRLRTVIDILTDLPRALFELRRGGDFVASYRVGWKHFVDCIRQDRPPQRTLEDGRSALQAALAAAESASAGKSVPLSPTTGSGMCNRAARSSTLTNNSSRAS
jgi:myo-inositol 2-dehydrogenase / D-chiro-inositol 1-dehydrogenase